MLLLYSKFLIYVQVERVSARTTCRLAMVTPVPSFYCKTVKCYFATIRGRHTSLPLSLTIMERNTASIEGNLYIWILKGTTCSEI